MKMLFNLLLLLFFIQIGAIAHSKSHKKEDPLLKIVKTEFSFNEGAQDKKPKYTVTLRFNRAIKSSDITGDNPTISYQTEDGTAVSTPDENEAKFQRKIDYYERYGYKIFKVGDTKMDIPIQFLGDRFYENDEYFYIDLSASHLKGENLNTKIKVTIKNDDILYIGIESGEAINEADVLEGKKAEFTIATDAVVPKGHGDVKVCYKTRDYPEGGAPATEGKDYEAKEGCVTIKEGDANTKTAITVYNDKENEFTEYFAVDLTSAEGGEIYDAYKEGVGVILDDDPKEEPQPVDKNDNYTIMDTDFTNILKTAILGKERIIYLKAHGHKPVKYKRERRDCNTCSGCGNWYPYQFGTHYGEGKYYQSSIKKQNIQKIVKKDKNKKIKYSDTAIHKYIVTDKKLETKLVSCGCGGGGGGGGGGGCGGGCSPPCTDYSEYRDIPDSGKYMNIAHIYLYGYQDLNCKIGKEVTDLLGGQALPIKEYEEEKDIVKFHFTPTKIYRCAYIEIIGYGDTPYYAPRDEDRRYKYHATSEKFAIRPDKFVIKDFKFSPTNPNIAATDINFTIEAVGADGKAARNYNQQIISTKSYKTLFYIKDKKYNNVLDYGFTFNKKFTNGQVNISTHYNEAGELTFKIEETPDDAYAIIDKGQEGNTTLLIQPTEVTFRVIPDHFAVSYENDVPTEHTLLVANEIEDMNSPSVMTIQAENAKGDVTKRYDKDGYAYDTKLSISNYIKTQENSVLKLISKLKVTDEIKNTDISKVNNSSSNSVVTTFDIKNTYFENGILTNSILLNNFQRTKNKPLEPIELHTSKIHIIETNGITGHLVKGETSEDKSNQFYYGKVHVPSPLTVAGTKLIAPYYYEIYCKNCDKTLFIRANNRASVDNVYWYILPKEIYSKLNGCDYTFSHFVVNEHNIKQKHQSIDKQEITIDNPPYEDRVYYTSKDYLLFDMYNKNVTEHYFDIKFTEKGAVWAGQGNLGNKVDEEISKIPNSAIDW